MRGDNGDRKTRRMYDLSYSYITECIFRYSETSVENPQDAFHRRYTHLYVEKRLGNIGLLLVLSDASTYYSYAARNGRRIPSPRYGKARAQRQGNIIFRYTGIRFIDTDVRRSDSRKRHCATNTSRNAFKMLSRKYFVHLHEDTRTFVLPLVLVLDTARWKYNTKFINDV